MPKTTSRRGARPRRGPVPVEIRRAAELATGMALIVRDRATSDGESGKLDVDAVQVVETATDTVELVSAEGRPTKLSRAHWEEVQGELSDLLRDGLAALDASSRAELLEAFATATSLQEEPSIELSAALYGIREILRERLPRCAVTAEQPAGLAVEQILAVDDSHFWLNGWMHDHDGQGAVTVVSPEGSRMAVSEGAYRYERPDVVEFYAALGVDRTREHGFTALLKLPSPSLLSSGWIAELRTSDGLELEIECPPVTRDPQAVRAAVLGELGNQGPIGGSLAADHGREALTRLQARIVAESKVTSIVEYGNSPASPAVSIVVPLYKRLDFLEHQMLQFSRDPELAEAELVYVLDSVEQEEELARRARELFALYGIPFRVVNLSSGAGFAGANRHGIEASRGKRLLLLNSDVIPDRPGWLGALNAFYDETERIGALGPKLLYEDDSLQHAGLYFHRPPSGELWENAHCFKGLHKTLPAANVARPVPAVTAACLLIDRDLYEEVGGLPLHYVQGDYEDSELCLKLGEAGRQNWYFPEVELYHLEGQSYVPGVRRVPSEYNMWLHTEIWGERMAKLMSEFDPFAPPPRH
jgi:GT2 family glycosyltransferase